MGIAHDDDQRHRQARLERQHGDADQHVAVPGDIDERAFADGGHSRDDLGERVNGWRWPLIWAAAAGTVAGYLSTLLPEWAELLFGIPAILLAFGAILWTKGFGPQDRELFRMKKADIEDLRVPTPADSVDAPR